MQLVLRSVNDQFFEQIILPVLEKGMVSSEVALGWLRPELDDERAELMLEALLDRHRGAARGTALWNLDQDLWMEMVHRLLFCEWERGEDGWRVISQEPAFVAEWELMLHLGLMVESPYYPYDEDERSRTIRQELVAAPAANLGMAAFFAGLWDPCPRFPPHEVLSTIPHRGVFRSGELCVADWSYRPASTVALWARQLATKLGRMLRREETRIAPVTLPDSKLVLDYWTGKVAAPPPLVVAYSGLGNESHTWVQLLGEIAGRVRAAAVAGRGLSIIITISADSFEERL